MLVLTGLTNSFDRMLHLTAYARTKNPKVIVVAGVLPFVRCRSCLASFLTTPAWATLKNSARSSKKPLALLMSQTKCCHATIWLTGWAGSATLKLLATAISAAHSVPLLPKVTAYKTYDLEYIRRQILASGKRNRMFFLDNNFYGSDRDHFHARLDLISEMRAAGPVSALGGASHQRLFPAAGKSESDQSGRL